MLTERIFIQHTNYKICDSQLLKTAHIINNNKYNDDATYLSRRLFKDIYAIHVLVCF